MNEIVLIWHFEGDVQVYDNGDPLLDTWLTTPDQCPKCRAKRQVVTAVGAMGRECPTCGDVDPFFVWRIPENALDHRSQIQ